MTAPDMFSFIDWNADPVVMRLDRVRACDLMRHQGATFLMAKQSNNPRGVDIAGWRVKPDPEPTDFDPPRVAANPDGGGDER